jgi:hypothetical protein
MFSRGNTRRQGFLSASIVPYRFANFNARFHSEDHVK